MGNPLSLVLTIITPPPPPGGLNWAEICRASTKVITFIDLAGHERYLKTTVFGMTGHVPDFCMMMVGANAGMIGMTKGLCMLFVCVCDVPVIMCLRTHVWCTRACAYTCCGVDVCESCCCVCVCVCDDTVSAFNY